jgi:asparagine synthase
MSKLVYVCLRDAQPNTNLVAKVNQIVKKISPDNIIYHPLILSDPSGIVVGINNYHQSVKIKDTNACLGYIHETDNWYVPSIIRPDGSFVLFRGDRDCIQVLTDAVASRTAWYYVDNDIFIASTSQRAIVMLLGSFEFNREVIPWMLSTGSLGPGLSWDRRIKRLGGDTILTLDRVSWATSLDTSPQQFSARQASDAEYEYQLRQVLDETFSNIRLDYSQWILLLSGGVDSRSILYMLNEKSGLKAVTWGLKSSLFEKFNDGYIAKQLADHFGLEHVFFETDLVDENIDAIFTRYIICGEGATDHISGYLDGFAVWRYLHESGIQGIIRGDEGFGWAPVASALDVRLSVGFSLWSDFTNLHSLKDFDFPEQKIPAELLQQPDESLEVWRDRLYQQFRIPVVLGALNDLKLSYVEIVNPLLFRKIIEMVRVMPDHLRTNKKLFRSIVSSLGPKIPYARQQAIADKDLVMKTGRMVEFLANELRDDRDEPVLPRSFLDYVLAHLTSETMESTADQTSRLKGFIKLLLPRKVLSKLKSSIAKPKMDFNSLAFRAFLIIRMYRILSVDSTGENHGLVS